MNKWLSVTVLLVTLVGCGGNRKPQLSNNEYPVSTAGAESSTFQTTYPAIIKGIQDVEIRPKISGFITKVSVHEGQRVGKGQLLFTIDSETYRSAVSQAKAALNTALTQYRTALMTYGNNKKLFGKNIIGQYELSTTENQMNTAKAAVEQAKAGLASAEEMLSYCYVKSPSEGFVGNIPYKQGALVSPQIAAPLTTVTDNSQVEVFFSVSEAEILEMTKTSGSVRDALASFPPVKLRLSDGSFYEHPGKVVKMSGMIDAATGSVSLIARFSNPDRLLKSGGSGQIVIPRKSNNVIIIPQEAASQIQDKVFVYKLGRDNRVVYSEITVAPQNDGKHYVVTSGLKVGDRYVTHGISSLTDSMEIRPITEAQYEENIRKAQELGRRQGSASGLIDALSGKEKNR